MVCCFTRCTVMINVNIELYHAVKQKPTESEIAFSNDRKKTLRIIEHILLVYGMHVNIQVS